MIRLKYVHFCTLATHTRAHGIHTHTHTERDSETHVHAHQFTERWVFLFSFFKFCQKKMLNQFCFSVFFPFSERDWLVGRLLEVLMYRKIKMVVHPEKRNCFEAIRCADIVVGFLTLSRFISIRSAKNSKWNFDKTRNKHGRCRV